MRKPAERGSERGVSPNDAAIGARVRALRLKIGVSQDMLAGACGISFQQVQKYERGANRIAASRLIDIADALGTSACALMRGLKPIPKQE